MVLVPALSEYLDPTYAPPQGVFISSNGRVTVVNGVAEFEVARVSRALLRIGNNIGQYFEAGSQVGCVYAGLFDASGSIQRAHVNLAEWRLLAGAKNTVESTILAQLGINEIFAGNRIKGSAFDFSRYLIKDVKVQLEVNDRVLDGELVKLDKTMQVMCHNVGFNNTQIAFNSRDLITSGPLDFLGSHASIKIVTPIVVSADE